MPNLIALFRLQQIDKQIGDAAEELELLKNPAAGNLELQEAGQALEKARAQKRDAERLQKDAELKLATLETEKKNVEGKLYGGKVVNSKELSGYQRDLEQIIKQRGKLDEQVLQGMETVEKLSRELQAAEKAHQELSARVEEEKRARELRVETLTRQMEELKSRRESYAQALDEPLLEQYVGLKERKGGVAVAKLQKNTCSACYMLVPESTVKKVKVYELEFCSSCGRILYMDKEL